MSYVQGTLVKISFGITDSDSGDFYDPAEIVVTVKQPSGTTTTLRKSTAQVTNILDTQGAPIVGKYRISIDTTAESGDWEYQVAVPGGTARRRAFTVESSLTASTGDVEFALTKAEVLALGITAADWDALTPPANMAAQDLLIGLTGTTIGRVPVGSSGQQVIVRSDGTVGYVTNTINVKAWGAAGDGVSDDSTEIDNALAAANALGGGVVYFPVGVYMRSTKMVVPGGVLCRGSGIDYMSAVAGFGGTPTRASIIKAAAGFSSTTPLVQFGSVAYPNAGWNNSGNTGASAEWLVFDANSAAQSAAQTFGSRTFLSHCEFRNGLSFALDLSGQNSHCLECIADNNNVGAAVQMNAADIKWKDGEIRNGATAHLLVTGAVGNIMVDGPDIYGGAVCPCVLVNVTASLTLGRIVNCNLNPTATSAIQITVSANQTLWGVMIANNKMYGPTAGLGGGFGVRIDVTAAGSAVDGLIFSGNLLSDRSNGQRSGGSGWSGLIARASSTGTVRNSVVVGNHANGMSGLFGGAFAPTEQWANTWVDNAGVSHQSSQSGSSSFSGDGTTVSFPVTHLIGTAPSQVLPEATSSAASAAHWVSAKSASTFTITFAVAPAAGSNNVTFDWLVKA